MTPPDTHDPAPLRGPSLLEWIASEPPPRRDAAVEEHLGMRGYQGGAAPPGDHLVGYQPSSVASIVEALIEVPVVAGDVVVDLGAGLGKVVFLAHLLTGARARGIEIQPALAHRANDLATRAGLDVLVNHGDARDSNFDDATVFFLYAPFTGPALAHVIRRMRSVAESHAIVVCALGIDLPRDEQWLVPRPTDSFWLTVYDSDIAGVPRRTRVESALGPLGRDVALERDAQQGT